MKRIVTLALVVFALAAVPAALADDGAGSTPAAPVAAQTQAPAAKAALVTRVEILRLRLQIVKLRYMLHCSGGRNADRCSAFTQKVAARLTTLDGNVKKRIGTIQQNCPSGSTDAKCKNADKRVAFLQNVDTHLQSVIARIQGGGSNSGDSSSSSTSDDALGQAASQLGSLVGSNG